MGEVYKGRDTRLNRVVAIKILASDIADDASVRARFEREAQAVAALDHPHICGIYDVGEANGTHFLVMPYLEGQTLAARLENGALPPDDTLKIGTELADALEKAHRKGIIHRDLKPANIMLTKAGSKLLDFGIAKLKAPASSMAAMTGGGTATLATAHGTVLGTVQYMAPEQLEGKDADPRSDIWALGAVLYEMTTGTRAFAGNTPASVIGAILKDTPPPISARQPVVPPGLNYVVERCLAKDPDERWQSIGDVGRMLGWIASNEAVDAQPNARPRHAWTERAAWIAATTVILGAFALTPLWRRPVVPTRDVVRLSVNPPERLAFVEDGTATVPTPQFAVSPDGRSMAFIAAEPGSKPTLWLRSWEDVDDRVLSGTEHASEPFWSPDRRWIGFFDNRGSLKKVAVLGGAVQSIAGNIPDPRGASWGTDDTILIGTGSRGVYRVAAAGGTPQAVTELDASRQEGSHRWPQFLPDGRHFLFTSRSALAEQRGVYLGSLDGKTRHLLLRAEGNARYAAPGYLLFLNEDTLLGQSFDLDRLELTGQATPIAARVGRSSRGDGAFSTSNAGTLAYSGARLRPGRLTWFDRAGNALGVIGPDGEHDYADFRLSPDETRVAASLVNPKMAVPDVWLIDLVRGGDQQLTFGPVVNLNAAAVWSPKGDRIVFRSNRKSLIALYQKSAGAGGDDQQLLGDDVARAAGLTQSNLAPSDWSPDGKYIAFASGFPADVWLLPLADDKKPYVLVDSISDQMHANFSPDSRFIAYSSNESGRYQVYVQTLPLSDRKWLISTNGGYEPRWRADSREIYFLSEDRHLMAVPVSTGPQLFGRPQPLFQTDVHPGVSLLRTRYVSSRDGTRFLVHTRSRDFRPLSITVVLNWTAGFRK